MMARAPKKVSPQVKSRTKFMSFPPGPGRSKDEAHCHWPWYGLVWPWGAAPRPGNTFFSIGPTRISRIHIRISSVNTHFDGALFRSTTQHLLFTKLLHLLGAQIPLTVAGWWWCDALCRICVDKNRVSYRHGCYFHCPEHAH